MTTNAPDAVLIARDADILILRAGNIGTRSEDVVVSTFELTGDLGESADVEVWDAKSGAVAPILDGVVPSVVSPEAFVAACRTTGPGTTSLVVADLTHPGAWRPGDRRRWLAPGRPGGT